MKFLLMICILISLVGIPDFVDTAGFVHRHTTSQFPNQYVHRAFVPPIPFSEKEHRCLTEAIYYEAGNQSHLGKEAVAAVVVNRVYSRTYPSTVCGVVYQSKVKDGTTVCQFSFICNERNPRNPKIWNESKIIAHRILHNYYHRDILHILNHALWFHADYVNPAWNQEKRFVAKIGRHLFYKESITKEST